MDFYRLMKRAGRGGDIEIYPDFILGNSSDLMVRGKSFYAVYDEETGFWSTRKSDLYRLVDASIDKAVEDIKKNGFRALVKPDSWMFLVSFENLRKNFNFKTWKNKGDDDYLGMFFNKRKIKIHSLMKPKFPCFFHDEIQPINGSNRNMKWKFLQDFSKNE